MRRRSASMPFMVGLKTKKLVSLQNMGSMTVGIH
jgi:hypothetical protein